MEDQLRDATMESRMVEFEPPEYLRVMELLTGEETPDIPEAELEAQRQEGFRLVHSELDANVMVMRYICHSIRGNELALSNLYRRLTSILNDRDFPLGTQFTLELVVEDIEGRESEGSMCSTRLTVPYEVLDKHGYDIAAAVRELAPPINIGSRVLAI